MYMTFCWIGETFTYCPREHVVVRSITKEGCISGMYQSPEKETPYITGLCVVRGYRSGWLSCMYICYKGIKGVHRDIATVICAPALPIYLSPLVMLAYIDIILY